MNGHTTSQRLCFAAWIAAGTLACSDGFVDDAPLDEPPLPAESHSRDGAVDTATVDATPPPTPDAAPMLPRDAGRPPPRDTGTPPPRDTGTVPPRDAGVPPRIDAGMPLPPRDGGLPPPVDTGVVPPRDAGNFPPADAGRDVAPPPMRLAPELGSGDHSPASVRIVTVLDGLSRPTGVAFHPDAPTEVWITNQVGDSFAVADVSRVPATATVIRDRSSHFLIRPTSLSFASDRTVATCHESNNDYGGRATPNYFMGPVVHPADRATLVSRGVTNSHLDMLHHSSFCMGIANVRPREWWAFNGQAGALDKYAFGEWHEPGGDDHSDGLTWRFAAGDLARVPGAPSQMAFDPAEGWLYIADTGNARVVRFDTRTPTTGAPRITSYHRETPLYGVSGTHVEEVIPRSAGLAQPTGLALRGAHVFVADRATGRLTAFTRAGVRVNWLDTGVGAGALASIAFGPDGRLYFLDQTRNALLRVEP